MKRKLLVLLTTVGALTLSGCKFFDNLDESYAPWEGGKSVLSYSQVDLRDNNLYMNYDTMPTSGHPKLLVLPIAFSDTSLFLNETQKEQILVDLEKAVFGTNEDTGWYSIASYYKAVSYGKCEIQGEVAPWYSTSYLHNAVNDKAAENIVKEAVNTWKSNNPTKVKEYDSDNNGYLDGVMAIYGCPNYKNVPGLNSNMWAYTSWLSTEPNVDNPSANVFVWASYDFMSYDTSGEVALDAHTYIHEMGHVFGLNDYYDYTDSQKLWAGAFSMQDYNIGGHDPYSLMELGWVDPYVPTESTTITIKPFESSSDLVLLSPDFSSNSPFDEYILLEFYSPTGVNEHDCLYQYHGEYPKGPNSRGIRIWHVDSRLSQRTTSGWVTTNTIDRGNGIYTLGCTNTTYSKEQESHCSVDTRLRSYHLLDLIRQGDFGGDNTEEPLSSTHLFNNGDAFSLSKYSGYFRNINRFNNGSRFKWNVTVNSVTATQATITVSR